MATEGMQLKRSMLAGGTITAYRFVKLSAARTVVQCSGVTDKPCGVAQESAVSGGALEVVYIGETKLEADAATNAGDSLGTSADGQAAVYTASDTTKHICGQALTAAAAAAGIIDAIINCPSSRTLA